MLLNVHCISYFAPYAYSYNIFFRFNTFIFHDMDSTRISTQVNVKHCSLCQGDTEYYCYGCQQDLCIQCKNLHVVDLSTEDHIVTSYAEKMKYPPKRARSHNPEKVISAWSQDPKQVKRWRSGDPKQAISVRYQDNHEPYVTPCRPHQFLLPVQLSPLEYSEIQRQKFSDRIYHIRGETIFDRSAILERLRYDRKTGHKAVTIRGLYQAAMRGQGIKDQIDEVLDGNLKDGNLKDRCIIQKTRMTRHMTTLLMYYHWYEQLRKTMETRPIKFLRTMTQKHRPRKDDMKTIINMLVNLMKEIRLTPSGIQRQARDVKLLWTLMPSSILQKTFSVTDATRCNHHSFVTPDRVWVSDKDSLLLTDIATGKQLHSVENPRNSGVGIHTVNSEGELIFIDKYEQINKLGNDMKSILILKGVPDSIWRPMCVYYSRSSESLLVGMYHCDTLIGKVMRYDKTGKHTQTIPHNFDTEYHELYETPEYITENNNGDVVVSDKDQSVVVVTSREGKSRFSYRGCPPGIGTFWPQGICTDVMSNILVCCGMTNTIQMLNSDGQFLSYIFTGIKPKPQSLSYDLYTHAVWIGSGDNNTMAMGRYINRRLQFTGKSYSVLLIKFYY